MGLLEMLGRVAWVYLSCFVRVVPILVLIILALLFRAMLNQVLVFLASNDRPRFEIGSSSRVRSSPETPATQTPRAEVGSSSRVSVSPETPATQTPRAEVVSSSRVRTSPETPATQTDLATVLDDPELHGRVRAGLEQTESLPRVIEEQLCTICQESMRADGDVKTFACKHEFHVECINEWLGRKSNCPNCWATIQIVPI